MTAPEPRAGVRILGLSLGCGVLAAIGGVLLLFFGFPLLWVGLRFVANRPVPDPNTAIPVPTSATRVQLIDLTKSPPPGYDGLKLGQRTRFLTAESPQAVLEFYRAELPQAGWRLDTNGSAASIDFYDWQGGCPFWYLKVYADEKEGANTLAHVDLLAEYCR